MYGYTSLHQKKQERSQIKKLILKLKELEKKEQTKPKASRRKEIIKIRAEINEIKNTIKQNIISETKSQFFKKINQIDKRLARSNTEKEREDSNY